MDIDRRVEGLQMTAERAVMNMTQDKDALTLNNLRSGTPLVSVAESDSRKACTYEDYSEVIYLKSDLLKDVGRAANSGGQSETPRLKSDSRLESYPLCEQPIAVTFSENYNLSKSQMVSGKHRDYDLWTLWLNDLKSSSN